MPPRSGLSTTPFGGSESSMDITMFSIPTQSALALVAIIGYFVGRRGRMQSQVEAEQARLELKRAKAVASDMYLRLRYAIDVAKAVGKPKENVAHRRQKRQREAR